MPMKNWKFVEYTNGMPNYAHADGRRAQVARATHTLWNAVWVFQADGHFITRRALDEHQRDHHGVLSILHAMDAEQKPDNKTAARRRRW